MCKLVNLNLRPPEKRSLAAQVLETLRQAIFDGDFPAGSRLIESKLADELEVSRGPVREAMIHLEKEGLVELSPNRGARVVSLGCRDAWEVYSLRARLEAWALELGWDNVTDHRLVRLGRIVDKMGALGPDDLLEAIDLDLSFHSLIVETCDHQLLVRVYESLDTMVGALFLTVKKRLNLDPTSMQPVHAAVLEALKSGDLEVAKNAVREQWLRTGRRVLELEEE